MVGAIVYSNACRERQVGHMERNALTGFTILVIRLEASAIVPTKSR